MSSSGLFVSAPRPEVEPNFVKGGRGDWAPTSGRLTPASNRVTRTELRSTGWPREIQPFPLEQSSRLVDVTSSTRVLQPMMGLTRKGEETSGAWKGFCSHGETLCVEKQRGYLAQPGM